MEHLTVRPVVTSSNNRRQRNGEWKKNFSVTSLGTGELSRPGGIRSSVKSLAIGTLRYDGKPDFTKGGSHGLTTAISKDRSFSVGSTASVDSFVPVLDSAPSSHNWDDELSTDPYLGKRRQPTVKREPEIPRCPQPQDTTEESVYAQTRLSSLMAASLPTTLAVPPPKRNPIRDDTSGVVLNFVPAEKVLTKAEQEQNYWKKILATRQQNHGRSHPSTADAHYSLGHAYLSADENAQAAASFKSACQIWRETKGSRDLSVSLGLDAYGLALMRHSKAATILLQAKSALDEAFAIRFHHLGVWHVDTVETFNKIASVHLHLGNYKDASKAYEEVYLVRKAIFGIQHPSVAISAHSLANVYLKLSRPTEARRYYNVALEIYKHMQLTTNHPTVAKLLRDRSYVERVGMSQERLAI